MASPLRKENLEGGNSFSIVVKPSKKRVKYIYPNILPSISIGLLPPSICSTMFPSPDVA
jgi:hypothetical protein